MRIPSGSEVTIDLWDSKKGKGMVRFLNGTLRLVRGESDFTLSKGDRALVRVIPLNQYSAILTRDRKGVKIQKLAEVIGKLLGDNLPETGGICKLDDLLAFLKETTLKDIIKRKHLKAVADLKEKPFDVVKKDGIVYFAVPPGQNTPDLQLVLALARTKEYLNQAIIQEATGWQEVRIERVLNYLANQDYCKADSSYRTGTRYFFIF
jgi:hypothetical protein